jgi:hypothetical protein
MSVSENTLTVSKYNWENLPIATVRDYITTVFKESHRLPDDWTFLIKDYGLYDNKRDGYVRDLVRESPHPNSYLRAVEDQIIEAMDSWAVSSNKDFLIWVSPSFAGEYPCHKIEILQKWPDFSGTNNLALLFDCDKKTCLKLIKKIFPQLEHIQDVEELRKSIIIDENLDINNLLHVIRPYLPKTKNLKEIPKIHFDYLTSLIQRGFDQRYIASEMQRLGIIGEHSFSCSGSNSSLSEILNESSLNLNGAEDQYGSLTFECPHCHKTNTRPYGKLIPNCQFCGEDVRC